MRAALLAIAVGLVLADSSVVTLGLPDVLADFDATPEGVSWVLTGYNLVLALAAVPAAVWLVRSGSAAAASRAASPGNAASPGDAAPPGGAASPGGTASRVLAGGLVLFAVASLACALAESLGVLVAARCVQGLGGAAVACAALPLLVGATGDRRRATAIWGMAGAIGAAVGPAAGGALTEALSWEAIFAVQVPIALVCVAAARGDVAPVAEPGPARRPDWRALASLALLGAGLTAALFLLVILLIAGWRHSPLAAAATVSVMPIAALTAGALGRGLGDRVRGATGAVLCAGGLAALGLLPGSSLAWTILPQALVGVGLGLGLSALTEEALRGRAPLALHGGWTLAARHAGVVAALAILTPIFTVDLDTQTDRAQEIVLARILDSPIAPNTKLDLGLGLASELRTESAVPDVGPAFAEAAPGNEDRPAFDELRDDVSDDLDRAAASAFERSFIAGAALAALALLPLLAAARGRAVLAAAVAGVALVGGYVALGGGGYDVARPAGPCMRAAPDGRAGVVGAAERVGLTALDGAACDLGVSRERLVLVLAGEVEPPEGMTDGERADAFRGGLHRAVDAEQAAGRLGGTEALILRGAIDIAPVDVLLEQVFGT